MLNGASPSEEPEKYNFKIDSQALGSALQEFAKQSGVQIIFFSQVTEGFRSRALNGQYTIANALQTLLIGSKLTFRVINSKTIEIRPLTATDPLNQKAAPDAKSSSPKIPAEGEIPYDQKKTFDLAVLDEVVVNGTAEGLVATRTETLLRQIPQTV